MSRGNSIPSRKTQKRTLASSSTSFARHSPRSKRSVLNECLLRNKIALQLGYKSWDDYQTEVKMAKTGANAEKYISDLVAQLAKFGASGGIQKLKAADTNDPNAKSRCGTGAIRNQRTNRNMSIRKRCGQSRSKRARRNVQHLSEHLSLNLRRSQRLTNGSTISSFIW